jgi:ABC-type spermidine/putrescine transport system permease subunit II
MDDPETDDNAQLTTVGCILTLFSVAVIVAAAILIVRWRDPDTGRPLPRTIAIIAPILIGAIVHGIGSLSLRLLGLRVWARRAKDADK